MNIEVEHHSQYKSVKIRIPYSLRKAGEHIDCKKQGKKIDFNHVSIPYINGVYDCIIIDEIMFDRLE